jgi:hypothetical protein
VGRWEGTLDAAGAVEQFEQTLHAGDSLLSRTEIAFTGDSATTVRTRGDSSTTTHAAAPRGTLPTGGGDGIWEPAIRRLVASGEEQAVIPFIGPADTVASTDTLRRAGPDSVTAGGGEWYKVDAEGRILAGQGLRRTTGAEADAMVASFRDRPLGPLSPGDSVRVTIGGATIAVDYSRPRKRGRVIFGGLVPWDQVWRSGANAATSFSTDADLVIGSATVPAGRYTLFTLPSASGWKLILNSKIGDEALPHDPARDMARVALAVDSLTDVVEAFTIAANPDGDGGVLIISWDRTAARVAFRKK